MTLYTLNKDIRLVRSNFDKYDFNFVKNDFDVVSGVNSYANAIIITVMTGWQELLKTNNPTYSNFGCKIHEVIKSNKSAQTEFEIEQYITTSIENMRRTKSVSEVTVKSISTGYSVFIRCTSITDDDVQIEIPLNRNDYKINTVLTLDTDLAYCNPNIPLNIYIELVNAENKHELEDIVYIYVNDVFVKTKQLKKNGKTLFNYTPTESNNNNTLKVEFKGNNQYNSSISELKFISEI